MLEQEYRNLIVGKVNKQNQMIPPHYAIEKVQGEDELLVIQTVLTKQNNVPKVREVDQTKTITEMKTSP